MMSQEKHKRSATMTDLARLAGVSQTTVSFVINNVETAGIPFETRERVKSAMAELGYRPNAVAQGLRRQRTNTIGFITDEIATTPFAGQIIKGAQDAGWDNEKILLVVKTNFCLFDRPGDDPQCVWSGSYHGGTDCGGWCTDFSFP